MPWGSIPQSSANFMENHMSDVKAKTSVKERYAVKLKNNNFALDENTNVAYLSPTKREAYQEFGEDANVVKVRVTVEEI